MTSKKYAAIGLESTYGVAVNTDGISVTGFSDNINRGVEYINEIGTLMPVTYHGGGLKLSGKMNGILRPIQLHPILASVFDGSSDPYGIGSLGSFTLDYGVGSTTNEQKKFVGCGVNKLTVSCNSGEFVKWDVEWVAKNLSTTESYSLPTYVTEDPLTFHKVSVAVDGGLSEAVGVTFTIDRKIVIDSFEIGSNLLKSLSGDAVNISGTLTFTEDEYNEFERMMFSASGRTTLLNNDLYEGALIITMKDTFGGIKSVVTMTITYDGGSQTINKKNTIQKIINFTAISSAANTTWELS